MTFQQRVCIGCGSPFLSKVNHKLCVSCYSKTEYSVSKEHGIVNRRFIHAIIPACTTFCIASSIFVLWLVGVALR